MSFGRMVGTAVVGFFFMLFVAVDLVLFGVLASNSALVSVLPVLGLVAGAALGALAGRRREVPPATEPVPEPVT